jgi:hypothetical protein
MHKQLRGKTRAGIMVLTCVAFGAALATLLPASAEARLPQPIYFWSNIPEPVSSSFVSNPLVIRPSTFVLFEDGQWSLQDMHWTGWGSSVAHATGISNSSNDIPNAAQGKRIKTWARVTLSDPGWFHGHEVYRCWDLAVPPPASDGPRPWCLAHVGSLWGLTEGAPPPPAAARPAPASPSAPLLGDAAAGAVGYGQAHPAHIGQATTSATQVTGLRWTHWGATQATATGTGYWLPPKAQSFSQAQPAPADVVAFDLGTCKGTRAYLKVEWFFPTHGERFIASDAAPICV